MRKHLRCVVPLLMAVVLFLQGCMLCRLTDRGFLGMSADKVAYPDRKYTGIFLLPMAGALDIATLPIQLLLLVFLGDDFPFYDKRDGRVKDLGADTTVARLTTPAQQKKLREVLEQRAKTQPKAPPPVMGLNEQGEWVEVPLTPQQRQALIAQVANR